MAEEKPISCLDCKYYQVTYSPIDTTRRTLYYDRCKYIGQYFAKLHIVLRGEYRKLKNHNREVLKVNFPYECPYYNRERAYWEAGETIKMSKDYFIYEMEAHGMDYYGATIYSLRTIILELSTTIPVAYALTYMQVQSKDESWFIEQFGELTVLIKKL